MKFFGRDQNKHTDNVEKPIIYYYAKQIGVLGKSIPMYIQQYILYISRMYIEDKG